MQARVTRITASVGLLDRRIRDNLEPDIVRLVHDGGTHWPISSGEEIGRTPDGDPIQRYAIASLLSGAQGDIDDFAIYAGQSVGLVREVRPASDIVRALVEEAAQIMAQRTGHDSG